MPVKSAQNATWRSTNLTLSDFDTTDDEGGSVDATDQPTEIFRAEIGDDNDVSSQLASYDYIRLGRPLDPTGNSGRGKINADLQTSGGDDVDGATEMRFVLRPRNSDQYIWTGQWYVKSDLERDDPRQRVPLEPRTNSNGDPRTFAEGRVLAIEFRNPGDGFDVSKSNSRLSIPASAGY